MIAQAFAILEFILTLFGLWDQFLGYVDKKRVADAAQNRQDREKAIDDQKNAKTEGDFDKAQDGIVLHLPKP